MADELATGRNACYQRLATIFPAGALVWIESEEYDAENMCWRVTLLHRNTSGQWERFRYRYDVVADILHFTGMTPVCDEEAVRIRRTAPRFTTGRTLQARSA